MNRWCSSVSHVFYPFRPSPLRTCHLWPSPAITGAKDDPLKVGRNKKSAMAAASDAGMGIRGWGVKFGHCWGSNGKISHCHGLQSLPSTRKPLEKKSLVTLQGYTQTAPSHGVVFRRTPCCVEWASLDTCVSPEVGLLWINLEFPGFTWRSNSRPLVCLEMGPQMVKNRVENGHLGTLFHPAHGE